MKLLFTSICTSIYTLICTSLPCVAQQWMTIKHALVVEIKTESSSSQLRFLLNNTDVTSRFKHTHGYQYIYRAKGFPLPSGVNNLTVYQVLEGQWQEIHSQEIKVLTSSGYETADWRMSGSVSVDAQLDAEYTGDAFKPENTRFRVANLQLNLSSQHSRRDFSIQTQANIVGTSKQENALRFYQSGKKADKVDLSDYLVTVKKGKLRLSVGHYGFGSNPLLVDNLGNRGIHVGYRLNRVFDLGITRKNGSAIVGWSNLLGQQNSQHSITASTIGAEVFPNEPGKLRIEMSYLDAQVQAINDFAIGQVSDVEKNQGWGVSIASQLWDGRMRFNGVFASSRYTNPDDEALLLGEEFELQSVKSSTDQAYQVNLELDLLTQQGQGTDFFTASLQLSTKKADALYKVIAAGSFADQHVNRLGLTGNLAAGQWQYSFSETENNVDRITSILTSNTQQHSFNYNIDLANGWQAQAAETQAKHYFPSINLSLQQIHQRAVNAPDAENSGFNGDSHLPDQMTKMFDGSANWTFSLYSLAYSISYSEQDNRQVGRLNADFSRVNHSVSQNIQMFDSLSINIDLGRARNFDHENNTVFYNNNAAVAVNYTLFGAWQMSLAASLNKDYDNFGLSTANAFSVNAGVDHQLSLQFSGVDISGQWYLRYAKQRSESADNVFAFNTFSQDWNMTSGLSLTF